MDHLATDDDQRLLRRAFALARYSKSRASGPYGAVLARNGSVAVEGENTVNENNGDPTCHAEMVLLRRAWQEVAPNALVEMTLYASTEPCPMCAGAIAAAGVKRLVYGASAARAAKIVGGPSLDCRIVLSEMAPECEVIGPVLEDEALAILG